jgi:predicted site-specific integrase-resolvase
MEMPEYMPLDALAAALGLPRLYLRRLARMGKIPCLNVTGRLRFDEAQVREALRRLAVQLHETADGGPTHG